MSTLIIVGAGATLAEATPSQPPVSRTPPLDSTFFRLCKAAKLTGLGTVGNYMRRYYDIDPTSNDYRMEEIFNFIYSDAFSPTSPDDCLDAYWSLIKMYGSALARTTNKLQGSSRSGVGALLRKLWLNQPGRAITFLTFNQDLVIEKAIEHTKSKQRYSDIPWNIRSAYRMGFSSYRGVRGGISFSSSPSEPSLAVLKLHGSASSGAQPGKRTRHVEFTIDGEGDWPRATIVVKVRN